MPHIGLIYLILKTFILGTGLQPGWPLILIGMFFLGSLQLFFIGFIGEYISSINRRVMNRPLVVEEERINFDKPEDKKKA